MAAPAAKPRTTLPRPRRLRFLEPSQKTSRQVCSAQDFSRTIGRRVVGPGMPGRYGSAARLFGWGAMPSGAGLVGLLAEFAGMRAAFGAFGVAAPPAAVLFVRVVAREALAAVPDPR